MQTMSYAVTDRSARDLIDQALADGVQKHVVGAYVVVDGKLLLLQRSGLETFLPNLVELPSGRIEKGETLLGALHREMLEETGLSIESVDRYINSFDYLSGSGERARQYNFIVTVAKPYAVRLNPEEHAAYYWVNPTAKDLAGYPSLSDKTRHVILDAFQSVDA
jgi:8-oxo-dGTP diphosphatase